MPKFVTIGYGDEDGYNRTDPEIRNKAHAHDAQLQADGALMGIAGEAVTVRNPGGAGIQVNSGPFLTAGLPVAGFAIFEADTLEEAIAMVSMAPCAVAHGVVEVWPLQEP